MAKASDKQENEVIEEGEVETEEVKTFTPAEIADATGADPKAIRAHLRANYTRPLAMKNKSWAIPADVADAVIEHFTASEEDVEEIELEDVEA